MELKFFEHDLSLRYPFSISRHTYYSQPNVLISLHHDGFTGYGEATINPYYKITINNLKSSFESIRNRLTSYAFSNPDQLFEDFSDLLQTNSFALAALNNASWDLFGKMKDIPVSELIDVEPGNQPMTSFTLGIDEPEKMKQKIVDFSWPIYKIKLGTDHDLELMQYIRQHTNSKIRVDANCAWNEEETIEFSEKLKGLDVEFIEQPLPRNDPHQRSSFAKSSLPIIADESCCTEDDVSKCRSNFHGINIKLLKCGGLSPAIRMVKNARKLGLSIMVGCMTESSVGIAAAAKLLPFVDFADLDGPLLLSEDMASGITFQNGYLIVNPTSGLGVDIDPKYITN